MAHDYVGILLQSGENQTGSTADLTLKNSSATQLATSNGVSADPELETNPSNGDPELRFSLGGAGNSFQHPGNESWSEPLELETKINDDRFSNTANPYLFESFSFSTSVGPLSDGDILSISGFALTYVNHPGVPAIVDSGGISNTDFRFTLKDGASQISDASAQKVNPVSYSGTKDQLSINANLEFTNNGSSQWNVDGLLCEAKDAGGTYRQIDDVSFTSVSVVVNATLRFTDVTHNFNYS